MALPILCSPSLLRKSCASLATLQRETFIKAAFSLANSSGEGVKVLMPLMIGSSSSYIPLNIATDSGEMSGTKRR